MTAPATTKTTRFNWESEIEDCVTEISASHLIELRDAADNLDYRIDDHVGEGGVPRHPTVTNLLSGFMSPELLDYLQTHHHPISDIDGLEELINDLKEYVRIEISKAPRVVMNRGIATHGSTIPLPAGFTEAECTWGSIGGLIEIPSWYYYGQQTGSWSDVKLGSANFSYTITGLKDPNRLKFYSKTGIHNWNPGGDFNQEGTVTVGIGLTSAMSPSYWRSTSGYPYNYTFSYNARSVSAYRRWSESSNGSASGANSYSRSGTIYGGLEYWIIGVKGST